MADVEVFAVACQTVNALCDRFVADGLCRRLPVQVVKAFVGSDPDTAVCVGADGVDFVDDSGVTLPVDVVACKTPVRGS